MIQSLQGGFYMNKLFKFSVFYTILGMVGGVFFREFTKLQNFHGTTTLGVVHTHAFMLGMIFFLLLIALEKLFELSKTKNFHKFLIIYNAGLLLTIVMLVVRGITQVLQIALTNGIDATISGFAGIGHILLGIGLLYFFIILKQQLQENKRS